MDRTKAAAIVNDFFADMNPSLWNGSTSMPKSFDDRAWQYPLADDVNLEITFVYNELIVINKNIKYFNYYFSYYLHQYK